MSLNVVIIGEGFGRRVMVPTYEQNGFAVEVVPYCDSDATGRVKSAS